MAVAGEEIGLDSVSVLLLEVSDVEGGGGIMMSGSVDDGISDEDATTSGALLDGRTDVKVSDAMMGGVGPGWALNGG